MTITRGRFERIRELFGQALDRPPNERVEFLTGATDGDTLLRDEVLALLALSDEPDGEDFLDPPTPDVFSGLMDDKALSMVGRRIGPYQLTRVIGFGGMGAVYEAHRDDDQFRKRVAIKLVKRGLETELAMRRFRHERQILATLDHRNIAGLLDGGVTDEGRPYFVLEYIEGVSITQYCRRIRLSVHERLKLFRQVCSAVGYAHRNLVVHRDLKPGNILVASDGTVKLLDFGIAKILGEDDDPEHAPLTRGGMRALTPEYASPEMLRGEPIAVAADVYSLGVVLFELVAGRRPFRFEDKTLAGLERAVCEEPAPKPSSVVSDDHAWSSSERSAKTLSRALAGDIDSIVLMALRKEPERRYSSVEALGDDLKRHVDGLPVLAERDRLGYRVGKFVGRNTVAVSIGGLLAASLVGGIVLTTVQARRANRERDKAQQVTNFLATMLAAPEPSVVRRDVTVAELLDSARVRADRELGREPEVLALVQSTIGHTYLGLGRGQEAEISFRSALAAYRRTRVAPGELTVALNNVASAVMNQGRLDEADSLYRSALAFQVGNRLGDDTTKAILLDNLGSLAQQRGEVDSAEALHRASLEIRERIFTGDNESLARAQSNLAVSYGMRGKYAPAESLTRSAAAMMIRLHGENHPASASVLSALAGLLDFEGKPEADSVYRKVLAIRRKLLGPEHPDYAWTLYNYTSWLLEHGRPAESIVTAREILALRGKSVPDSHPAIGGAYLSLGRAELALGRFKEAEVAIRESIAIRTASLPPGHWVVASSQVALAELLIAEGKPTQARPILETALERLEATVGPNHPRTGDARKMLTGLSKASNPPR